jgi:hypothetical protein
MNTSTPRQIPGLYHLIPLHPRHAAPGIHLHDLKLADVGEVTTIERLIHGRGAVSPAPVGYVLRPWHMHTHQIDNLLVLHGTRYVELYWSAHGSVERFTLKPDLILHGDNVLFEGAAIFGCPTGVFHRVVSCDREGSAALNLIVQRPGIDLRSNANLYDLDIASGQSRVVRAGHLERPRP